VTYSEVPGGPAMHSGAGRSLSSARAPSRTGSMKVWSAWKWVSSTVSISLTRSPARGMSTGTAQPQSTRTRPSRQ
jgi:hypothetical protein